MITCYIMAYGSWVVYWSSLMYTAMQTVYLLCIYVLAAGN